LEHRFSLVMKQLRPIHFMQELHKTLIYNISVNLWRL
jgi:hypothetical protein